MLVGYTFSNNDSKMCGPLPQVAPPTTSSVPTTLCHGSGPDGHDSPSTGHGPGPQCPTAFGPPWTSEKTRLGVGNDGKPSSRDPNLVPSYSEEVYRDDGGLSSSGVGLG